MVVVTGQMPGRTQSLAQVVGEGAKADQTIAGRQSGRRIQGHFHMDAGIHFRMVMGWLRYPVQSIDFRQDTGQGAAGAQTMQKGRRGRFAQGPQQFLKDPFRHQMIDFTGVHHLLHQGQGFRRDDKTQPGPAGHETGCAQDAHRIFGKGVGDMAQDALVQIALAAVGIDQRALIIPGHGVDGEIAPGQILFQADVGCGQHDKTTVAAPGLALATRQGVFLVGLRVQKDGKILSHRAKALSLHGFWCNANHDEITITRGQAEQFIAYRTAHQIGFHDDASLPTAGQLKPRRSESGTVRPRARAVIGEAVPCRRQS